MHQGSANTSTKKRGEIKTTTGKDSRTCKHVYRSFVLVDYLGIISPLIIHLYYSKMKVA